MIDHVTVRVRDFERSKAFFAKALEPLGYTVMKEFEGFAGLGARGKADLWLARFDKKPNEQPLHLAFPAPNRKAVHAFYDAAIAAGAKDNGKPGRREQYHPNFYGAFVLDPDGNNIEACCHDPE